MSADTATRRLTDGEETLVYEALASLRRTKQDALIAANSFMLQRAASAFHAHDFGLPQIDALMRELCPSYFDHEGQEDGF